MSEEELEQVFEEIETYAELGRAPRHIRRERKRVKHDPAFAQALAMVELTRRFADSEERVADFADLFNATRWLKDTETMRRAPDRELEQVAVKLRWIIHDCEEATELRTLMVQAIEALPPKKAAEYDLDRVKTLRPIDTDTLRLILWEIEDELKLREAERREARRKEPRVADVVEVPPVVIDTTCDADGCQRERHFIIEGVAYCKRHVPPHLRPHGRI